MKTRAKELLSARFAILAAVLAAIVGVCAFSFSGTQQNAWAEEEAAPLAAWDKFTNDPDKGFIAEDPASGLNVAIKDGQVTIENTNESTPDANKDVAACKIVISVEDAPAGASSVVEVKFPDGIKAKDSAKGSYPAGSPIADCPVVSAKLMPLTETGETPGPVEPAPAKVTITFETAHGVKPADMQVDKDTAVALPGMPNEEDWIFNGWSNAADPEIRYENLTGTFSADTTLKADWTEAVTIQFKTDHGEAPADMQVGKGNTAKLPTLPNEEDFIFNGWTIEGSGDPVGNDYAFNNDTVLIADWDPATFDVKFMLDKNTVHETVTVEKDSKFEASDMPKDPARDGFVFKGWYQGETKFEAGTVISKDITLLAKWEPVAKPGTTETTASPANKPATFSIVVTKTDFKKGNPLSGAEFKLTDKAGNEVASWTSDGTGKVVELQQGTSYVLTETKAPAGYRREKAININYKDGEVLIDQGAKIVPLNKNNDGIASLNVKDLSIDSLGATTATTGDNQAMPLATLCVGAVALLAGGAASIAYRKRTA